MKCPKCAGDLHTIKYQEIDVERCSNCAFFDAGEFRDLKELKVSAHTYP
jgi:Zn-finger nucleic acid-binding protein